MRKCLVLVFTLIAAPAWAQQKDTTAQERLALSLGQCIGLMESRNDQVMDLQKKLDAALAELKSLKEKSDAK